MRKNMSLKERILRRKHHITKKEFDTYMNSDKGKMNEMFIQICDRLEDMFYGKEINCQNNEDVFKIVEEHHIFIFDIVNKEDYEKLKEYILNKKNKWCPVIGKHKTYNLNKKEDLDEFMRTHNDITL